MPIDLRMDFQGNKSHSNFTNQDQHASETSDQTVLYHMLANMLKNLT